jgi:hypothetical protein
MPYNGYTSAERIRSWQLQKFYEFNGWCQRQQQCCVTGALGIVDWHNENYFEPWIAPPISKALHKALHQRFRYPERWRALLAEIKEPSWVHDLSVSAIDLATAQRAQHLHTIESLLERAPHPEWVLIPPDEFDR